MNHDFIKKFPTNVTYLYMFSKLFLYCHFRHWVHFIIQMKIICHYLTKTHIFGIIFFIILHV